MRTRLVWRTSTAIVTKESSRNVASIAFRLLEDKSVSYQPHSSLAEVRRDVVRDRLELVIGQWQLSTERTPRFRRLLVPKHGTIRSVENAANADLSDESGHPLERVSPTAENERKLRHIEVQILGGSMWR